MIAIVDYGMGNLASVFNAVRLFSKDVRICSNAASLSNADKLILPGVGSFKNACDEIQKRGLLKPILKFIDSNRPFLGICLGLQLLFSRSYEEGTHKGFNLIKGDVKPFVAAKGFKVPHMGWNEITGFTTRLRQTACPLLYGIEENTRMYFVHSYYAVPEDDSCVVSRTCYGDDFCSMIHKDNIYAVQFHPEKSQDQGLKIIKNFVNL
jgi:imidazole glycerol-phosphate synthase subunit HisH